MGVAYQGYLAAGDLRGAGLARSTPRRHPLRRVPRRAGVA